MSNLGEIAQEALRMKVMTENNRFPPSQYYCFLYLLAQKFKPNLSVILGVCGGGCCYHTALGYPDGKVVGVDIADDYPDNREFITRKCANFEFMRGDSVSSAERIYQKYGRIDIVFVDTDHTRGQTLNEFNAYYPCLNERAIMIFDDLFRPGMEEAWDQLPGEKFRFDELHPPAGDSGGFGVLAFGF